MDDSGDARALRVVMLLSEGFGGTGGIAKFNRDLLGALAGHARVGRIDALPRVAVSEDEQSWPANVSYDRGAARGAVALFRRVAARAVRREGIDVVLCGHIHLLPPAWLLARLRGARLVLIVHGYEAWTPPRRPFVRPLARRIDGLMSVSRVTAQRFRAWAGNAGGDFVLPNSVDLECFKPAPRDPALAERYGLGDGPVLMTLGRMAAREGYKGFDKIIELMPRLRQRFPGLRYLIVGDGDDRARLEAKAASLDAGDSVVFTGAIAESGKADHYNLADVFVLPSTGEGFGIVLIEAAACGLAVVGSSRDGSREALLDGALGQLVDPDDDDALIGAIAVALPRKRERNMLVERFSAPNFTRRVAQWVEAQA